MHFFITGHTGFKGAWFTLLLREMGHEVSGYSLPPLDGSLFDRANVESDLRSHFTGDIRDKAALVSALLSSQPDVAVHFAAQPLVLRSYVNPTETFTTNVDGTLNFLEAVSQLENIPSTLVITTDKVYKDTGLGAYPEDAPLGGHDPYSASKAMADILTQSWAKTFPAQKIKIARAGNVIGAFDVSENRLIPDIVRSALSKQVLEIRNPNSVRPWQHVLDCLWGYYLFLEASRTRDKDLPTVLNFGPEASGFKSVKDVFEQAQSLYPELEVAQIEQVSSLKETSFLTLDSTKARELLGWVPEIGFALSVKWAIAELKSPNPRSEALSQVQEFLSRVSYPG